MAQPLLRCGYVPGSAGAAPAPNVADSADSAGHPVGGQHRASSRAGDALHWAPLNWFGYLLLVAGPVALDGGADGAGYASGRSRIVNWRPMSGTSLVGTLDGISIYEITPTATTFLADEYERWGHLRVVTVVPGRSACRVGPRRRGDRLLRPALARPPGEAHAARRLRQGRGQRGRIPRASGRAEGNPPLATALTPRRSRYAFGFTGRQCDTLSWLHAGCGAAW